MSFSLIIPTKSTQKMYPTKQKYTIFKQMQKYIEKELLSSLNDIEKKKGNFLRDMSNLYEHLGVTLITNTSKIYILMVMKEKMLLTIEMKRESS